MGVAYNGVGPSKLVNSGSIGYDGSTTQSAEIVQTPVGLTTFSIGVWFKTSVASGVMIEYADTTGDVLSGASDRHLYMLATGQVAFGVDSAGVIIVNSPAGTNYADGAWHYAVGTMNSKSAGAQAMVNLYVDGSLSATSNATKLKGTDAQVQARPGYWHLGVGRTAATGGVTGAMEYFTGNLSNASVSATEWQATGVANLYASTSQAGFASTIATLSPYAFWALNDTGLVTYAGSLPVIGTTSPCSAVQVTIGTSGKCLYPILSTVCPALSSAYLLSGLANQSVTSLTGSASAVSQTITSTVGRDSTYNTGYDVGLNLLVPIVITEKGFLNNTFTWSRNLVIS